jgi:hypothetical protein
MSTGERKFCRQFAIISLCFIYLVLALAKLTAVEVDPGQYPFNTYEKEYCISKELAHDLHELIVDAQTEIRNLEQKLNEKKETIKPYTKGERIWTFKYDLYSNPDSVEGGLQIYSMLPKELELLEFVGSKTIVVTLNEDSNVELAKLIDNPNTNVAVRTSVNEGIR